MASEAQLKGEIAKLQASINKHKSSDISTQPAPAYPYRRNTYTNPNYKPNNKYIRPVPAAVPGPSTLQRASSQPSYGPKEVILGGVAFSSSRSSLVRKDLPKPPSTSSEPPSAASTQAHFERKSGHLIASSRAYKPQSSRGRRGRATGRNMTLTNNRRPYQARRTMKRMKSMNKQCPRFSTTGAQSSPRHGTKPEKKTLNRIHHSPLLFFLSLSGSCSHGLTCMYQHDPTKIAICWKFLQDNCPNTADTCNLSHDPTPERTPLCSHFLNKGRCARPNCHFPHVNVGARHGVCRDFAVLGYCEKGLDCEHQHVRECPDFAEKGTCSTKGCKLPHVIRANRNRKPADSAANSTSSSALSASSSSAGTEGESSIHHLTADDAQLGDEYISLTFNESESSEEEEGENEDEDEEEEVEEEGDDPNDVEDMPVVG
uniref:C3H1-type domain-containing protein n=1 Tax=Moniliophthora roreri TaxID=221103 RepID=A0A0W0G8J7_MONRR